MKTEQLGYGHIKVTNGYQSITAKFERGTKGQDGVFHPHYLLTFENGLTNVVYMNRQELDEYLHNLLEVPRSSPMTKKDALEMQKRDGCISGIVGVYVNELLDSDIDTFLDTLNNRLCEVTLHSIEYYSIAVCDDEKNLIAFYVTGKLYD